MTPHDRGGQPPDVAAALAEACQRVGLDPRGATLLRHFANAVFAVAGVVGRVSYGPGAVTKATRALTVTHWLAGQGFPVAAPVSANPGEHPVVLSSGTGGQVAVTFWEYHPQDEAIRPDFHILGQMARQLHDLPGLPPAELPRYEPLGSLLRVLASTAAARALGPDDAAWLTERATALAGQAAHLPSQLGTGLIHGDLYSGNLLQHPGAGLSGWLLGDWDSVCIGPREVDLAPTSVAARFGLDGHCADQVAAGYGFDVRTSPAFAVLREIRELSTLSALIKLAGTQPESARELKLRTDSLRSGDTRVRWHRQ